MEDPEPSYIRPITDDRRWRAVINEEKGTLEFYRDDENGKWSYEEVKEWVEKHNR